VAIFGFVWIGEPELALFGAIIEVIINIYYYSQEIWQRKQDSRDKAQRRKDMKRFWRNNWIAIFMGLLFPALIYIFSHILLKELTT
jgi:mannose/fructose/N-acetylgalactosamine-specific phosphotransferase system component IIC